MRENTAAGIVLFVLLMVLGLLALFLFRLLGGAGLAIGGGFLIVLSLLLVSNETDFSPDFDFGCLGIILFALVCLVAITAYLISHQGALEIVPKAVGIGLWFLLIVGAIKLARSTSAAAIAFAILLLGLFVTYQSSQISWQIPHVPIELARFIFPYGLAGLFIVLSLLGLLSTGSVGPGEVVVILCGLLGLVLITLASIVTGGKPAVLGVVLGLWLLLILGSIMIIVRSDNNPRPLPSTSVYSPIDKEYEEGPNMTSNRTHTRLAHKVITNEESRLHQHNLDALINEQTEHLSRGDIRIYRNPFTNWFRYIRIHEGRQAVLLCNGKAQHVLSAGAYHVFSFPWFRKIELRVFNVKKDRPLDIKTGHDFILFYNSPRTGKRTPVEVSLDVVVRYKVVDPMRLVQYDEPLLKLYDTAVAAMRAEVEDSSYEEFKAGGRAGKHILNQLQRNTDIAEMGIEVLSVEVVKLEGAEEIDKALKADELAGMGPGIDKWLNPELHARLREIERQEGRDRVDAIIAAIAHLPPPQAREFLDRIFEQPQLVRPQVVTVLPAERAMPILPEGQKLTPPKRIRRAGQKSTPSKRIRQEVASLQRQGISAMLNDSSGTYRVTASFLDADETPVKLVIECPAEYPQQAPTLRVERGGTIELFTPDALRTWGPDSSLTDLVTAARQAYE